MEEDVREKHAPTFLFKETYWVLVPIRHHGQLVLPYN